MRLWTSPKEYTMNSSGFGTQNYNINVSSQPNQKPVQNHHSYGPGQGQTHGQRQNGHRSYKQRGYSMNISTANTMNVPTISDMWECQKCRTSNLG